MDHRPRSTPRTTNCTSHQKEETRGLIEAPGKTKPHFFGTFSEYLFPRFLREKTVALGKPGETTHATQNRQRIPHFSDETISCPVVILGVSRDSGHSLCLDGEAKLAVFSLIPEQFSPKDRMGIPDSISGLIIRDFLLFLCFYYSNG